MPLNLTCGASFPAERQVRQDRAGHDLNKKGWADRAGFDLDFGGTQLPEHGDALTAQQVVAATRAAFVVDKKAWADRAGIDLDVDAGGREAKESKEVKASAAQAPARAGWDPFADPTEASRGALAGAHRADPVKSAAAAAATGGGAPDAWDPFADPADACSAVAEAPAPAGAEAAASGRGRAGDAGRPQRTSASGKQGWAQRLESARAPASPEGAAIPAVHGDPAPELRPDKGPSYEELMASLADLEDDADEAGAGGGGPSGAAASSSAAAPPQPSPAPAGGSSSSGGAVAPVRSEPESGRGAPELPPAGSSAEPPDLQDLLARIDEEEKEAARAAQAAAPQGAAPPEAVAPASGASAKPAKKRYGGRGSWLLSVDGPPPEPRAQRPPSPPAPRRKSPPARRRPSPPPPPEPREPRGEAAASPSAGSGNGGGGDTASLAAMLAKLDCEEEAETSRELFRGLGQDAAAPARAAAPGATSLLGGTDGGTWGSEGSLAWILRHTSQDMDMQALQRLGAGEQPPAEGAPPPADPEPQPAEPGGVFSGSFFIQRPRMQTRGGASASRPEPRAFGQDVPAKLRRPAA